MPVRKVKGGYKYGPVGKVYPTKAQAEKQGRAIKASQARQGKAVMISIRPKWVEKIASGEKTIEVRKTAPKLAVPFKCYIYETKKLKCVFDGGIELRTYEYQGKGKVVGEFVCDKIYNFVQAGAGIMFADEELNQLNPQEARDMTCLSDDEISKYLGNKDGYGWHISDLKIYDKPDRESVV